MERTDYNGNLRLKDVGRKVVLLGWVANKRNLGAIMNPDSSKFPVPSRFPCFGMAAPKSKST